MPSTGATTSASTLATWTSAMSCPPGDAVTVRDVPGGQHALGVGVGVVDRWEEHLGHASTVLIAASIRSCRGSTAYSRSWA